MLSSEMTPGPASLLLALSLGTASAWFMTPLVIRIAFQLGAVDHPSPRRPHAGIKPRAGGISVCLGSLVVLVTLVTAWGWVPPLTVGMSLAAGGVIFILGLTDDIQDVAPILRLIIQTLAAHLAFAGGVSFPAADVLNQLLPFRIPPQIDYFLTVLWLVGMTNAFNLIDGLDFLVTGIGLTASASLVLVALWSHQMAALPVFLGLLASLTGFAPYNLHPSRSFLGDCGATLLGFMLAALALVQFEGAASPTVRLVVPLVLLAIPLIDTSYAIFRRLLQGRSLLQADRGHLHHRLLAMGFTMPQATRWLLLHQLAFCAIGLAGAMAPTGHGRYLVLALALLLLHMVLRMQLLSPEVLKAGTATS